MTVTIGRRELLAAFGGAAAFGVGWLVWLARLTAFAANCNLLVTYLGLFWPAAAVAWGRPAVIVIVVGALAAINLVGVRYTALVSNCCRDLWVKARTQCSIKLFDVQDFVFHRRRFSSVTTAGRDRRLR